MPQYSEGHHLGSGPRRFLVPKIARRFRISATTLEQQEMPVHAPPWVVS